MKEFTTTEAFGLIPEHPLLHGRFMVRPSNNFWGCLERKSRSEILAENIADTTSFDIEERSEWRRQFQCRHNMQRIVLAMFLYEKEHGSLPPTFTVDAENRPLHSWRVLILPYLGTAEKKLYENIRLDEPWDSDWNKQFHETEIKLYTCPSTAAVRELEKRTEKGITDYTVITGEEMSFAVQQIFDSGANNTTQRRSKDSKPGFFLDPDDVMLAERMEPICWMVPNQEISRTDAETSLDERGNSTVISEIHDHRTNFAFKSGAVWDQTNSFFEHMKQIQELTERVNE